MSSHEPKSVVDTVVLRYFLLVGRTDLLLATLGKPLGVPRVVYDPEENVEAGNPFCELTRSIAYQRARAKDGRLSPDDRAVADRNVVRLGEIAALHRTDALVVLDLETAERQLYGRLTSPAHVEEFGLLFPLDPGEAACLAMALERNMTLATDDSDALAALKHLAPAHPYQRIRKLLRQLGVAGAMTKRAANELHAEMTALNFWDRERPFPDDVSR